MRLVKLDLMEFKSDEFHALALARYYVEQGSWPLVGLRASQGLFYPPFFLWLLMPAVWLTQDPIQVTAWIAFVNSCGLWILYRLLRQAYPASTALAGTALFAAAPWSFIHARKIWSPDLLPPFVFASLLMTHRFAERPTVSTATILGLCFGLATQLHLTAWFLVPGLAGLLYFYRVLPKVQHVLGASLALLVLYLPYAYYQFHTSFHNLSEINIYAPAIPVQHLFWAFSSASSLGFETLIGASGVGELLALPGMGLVACVSAMLLPLAVAGMLLSARTLIAVDTRAKEHSGGVFLHTEQSLSLLLMSTFAGVLLIFGISGLPALPHYYVVTSAIPAVWAALALARLAQRAPRLAPFLVLSLVLAQLAYTTGLLWLLETTPQSLNGDYGVPYRHVRDLWNERFEALRTGHLRLNPRQVPQGWEP